MKEIEVKILEINAPKIKKTLKKNGAELIMRQNKQVNLIYSSDETKEKGIIRLRKDSEGSTFAIKSKVKFIKGHKIMKEYESRIDSFNIIKEGLEMLGFRQIGCVESIREDWKLFSCLVSIITLPKIPTYVEIEGNKKNILKVTKLFGYTEKDFYPEMIYEKYGVTTKFLKFKK